MAQYKDLDFEAAKRISEFLNIAEIRNGGIQIDDTRFLVYVNRDDMCNVYKSNEIPEAKGGAYELCRMHIEHNVFNSLARLIWDKMGDEVFCISGYIYL